MEVVAEADDAKHVLTTAGRSSPDVVLLDLTLPNGGGLALIEPLTESSPTPRVIVLSMHNDPAYVRSALAAGATGYTVKSISEQSLLSAVRDVARGRVIIDLDDDALTANVFQALTRGHGGTLSGIAKLSDRELEVLRLLGRGLTNQVVAEQLDVSPKTVATYRARIGQKLGLKTTAEFVKYAQELKP